jgi:hypothetical protein
MSDYLSYRLMENAAGPGWYWEIFSSDQPLMRGLAATQVMAMAQITEVMHSLEAELMPRPSPGAQLLKRAIEAQRQAEHAYDPILRSVLEGNANNWERLAEQIEWIDVTVRDATANVATTTAGQIQPIETCAAGATLPVASPHCRRSGP